MQLLQQCECHGQELVHLSWKGIREAGRKRSKSVFTFGPASYKVLIQ